jgi:hypothetical protein
MSETSNRIRNKKLPPLKQLIQNFHSITLNTFGKIPKGNHTIYALYAVDDLLDPLDEGADLLKIGRASSLNGRINRYKQCIRLNQNNEPCPTTSNIVQDLIDGFVVRVVFKVLEIVPTLQAAITQEIYWQNYYKTSFNFTPIIPMRETVQLIQ